jgi:hypothetical protein
VRVEPRSEGGKVDRRASARSRLIRRALAKALVQRAMDERLVVWVDGHT